jgi:glycosyltransferase involved in cell wall biosynthesis
MMRVAVVHNLVGGGAHRRMREHMSRLPHDVVEICLATADPVSDDAEIVPLAPRAPQRPRPFRVPLRYVDLGALVRAWRLAAIRVRRARADVVYANPCRFLQAPAALAFGVPPSLYFCDEARRVDHDPSAIGSRNPATRRLYGPMYRAERALDARATAAATRLATNSRFSATEIARAYGREAVVVPMGVGERFIGASAPPGRYLLSVGSLIPSKGHDLVIAAAARAARRPSVVVVAPHPDRDEATRLERLAGAAGVELDVRTGISDSELAHLYAGARATLYLAAREPLGLVSLEAQAAGSPVIVADEGGLPETLAPGQREWAVARDPAAVAARLDALEDDTVRAGAVAAARAHAGRAGWDDSARQVAALLDQLLG